MASEERERLNHEATIVTIADTIEDRQPASKDELRLVTLGLFTFCAAVLVTYLVMPSSRRTAIGAILASNTELILLTLLTYILLLITLVALAYSMLRRLLILKTAEGLAYRLRFPEGWLEDDRPLSDVDIADALVLSWNLTASGDLEIAARLRAFLPKNLLQHWPIYHRPIRRRRFIRGEE